MATNAKSYSVGMINESGYVVMLPNVGDATDVLMGTPPNPYAQSAMQLFPLGTKLVQGERVWRYCKNGTTALTTLGVPIMSQARAHAEQDDDIDVGAAGAAIGAFVVPLTGTANLDTSPNDETNAFAEGYLYVNDEAGEGQMYKIKSNEAFVTTAVVNFTLYDPLTVALTTASQVGLIRNPYDRVLATTAPLTGVPVGVPNMGITASYYFWSQTGGPAAVVCGEAIPLGTYAVVGVTAAVVMAANPGATGEYILGYTLTLGVTSTESIACFLTLDR